MLIPQAIVQQGSSGLTVISDSTLGAPAANFDITGIPAGYRALWVFIQARSSRAAIDDALMMRLNNDSGANYDHQSLYGSAVSGSATSLGAFAQTVMVSHTCVGNSGPAGNAGTYEFLFPNYDATTFNKSVLTAGSGPTVTSGAGYFSERFAGTWRSTAAITRITVFLNTGPNFMTGSRLTVFGI